MACRQSIGVRNAGLRDPRKGVIFTTVSQDEITIRPYGFGLRCTPQSVAAHSLYENSDPYLHRECSGTFDLTRATFEAIDGVTVRIRGSEFISQPYTVKLEGAELAGYQSIIVGGIRDPYIIRQLDSWLASVRSYIDESVARVLGDKADKNLYSIFFHTYGINAVMGGLEPDPKHLPTKWVSSSKPQRRRRTWRTSLHSSAASRCCITQSTSGRDRLRHLRVSTIPRSSIGARYTAST